MDKDELRELAALYALELAEGDDRERFEQALKNDPDAALFLAEYREAVGALPLAVELKEPPHGLEEKVFARLIEQGQGANNGLGLEKRNSNEPKRMNWIPWAVAASLAIMVVALWSGRVRMGQAMGVREGELLLAREELNSQGELIDSLRQRISAADALIAEQGAEIERQVALLLEQEGTILALEQEAALDNLRISVLKSQLESMPSAEAVAVWNTGSQRGRLAVSNLPAVPSGQAYQLWLINSSLEAPVSAGVFNTDETGEIQYAFSGVQQVQRVDAFALSVEEEGGKPAPEGPIVLVGE